MKADSITLHIQSPHRNLLKTEILLLVLLGILAVQTQASFDIPVMYDFAASHTTLIQILSMSASSETFRVGILFKSFCVDQCVARLCLTDEQDDEVDVCILVW